MLKFNRKYFAIAVLLLFIEILIAMFAHDKFIRPYVGDYLVVILVYCFLKSFINLPVQVAAVIVLLFSFSVEIAQYLNLVSHLGLQNSETAKTIIGNSFSWADILAYSAGILSVIITEKYRNLQNTSKA